MTIFTVQQIPAVSRRYMEQWVAWIAARLPFVYIRFSDGEMQCMSTGGRKHWQCNNLHSPALARGMKRVIREAAAMSQSETPLIAPERILIGAHPTLKTSHGVLRNVVGLTAEDIAAVAWCPSQMMVNGLGHPSIVELFELLRCPDRPVVFVCNARVAEARYGLGADLVEVPEDNAWADRGRIMRQCRELAKPHTLFLWMAGASAKPMMWDVWKTCPETTHMDAGQFFDPAVGIKSRAWTHRLQGSRMKWYRKHICPLLRRYRNGESDRSI